MADLDLFAELGWPIAEERRKRRTIACGMIATGIARLSVLPVERIADGTLLDDGVWNDPPPHFPTHKGD